MQICQFVHPWILNFKHYCTVLWTLEQTSPDCKFRAAGTRAQSLSMICTKVNSDQSNSDEHAALFRSVPYVNTKPPKKKATASSALILPHAAAHGAGRPSSRMMVRGSFFKAKRRSVQVYTPAARSLCFFLFFFSLLKP